MNILEELQWRGLYADCTDLAGLTQRLASGPTGLYCGFDPTSDSLHVGNLVPLLALRRFQLAGHRPIALAGGATGMIGDPSGRSLERNLLTPDQVHHNIACIQKQLSRFLDFGCQGNPAVLVDNATWTQPVGLLEFLRDIGKHFTIHSMLGKDSVRSRLEGDGGLSFTEFSYMLLQAYDFHHLRAHQDCELQVGATDQWGNITAGTDLIRRKQGVAAYGLVFPLLTKADGTKYGKSASGAVWLDPARTSVYRFYQFLMQSEDVDVVKLLRFLTFLPREEVEHLAARVQADPGAREAQRALAEQLTTLVHGAPAAADARRASEIMFGGALEGITQEVFMDVVGEVHTTVMPKDRLLAPGCSVVELLVHNGLCPSKGQARKDMEGGGVYVNNVRVAVHSATVAPQQVLFGAYVLLRKGKKNYAVTRFE